MNPSTWELFLLTSLPGFGPRSLRYLIARAGELGIAPESIGAMDQERFESLFPELGKARFAQATWKSFGRLNTDQLRQEFDLLLEKGIKLVPHHDSGFPSSILQRMGDDAPLLLYVKGNAARLAEPSVAVVGSRNITDEVAKKARMLSARFSRSGFLIVSGNAKGVDQAAQLGALDANGCTVLVLPEGILRFSPTPEQRDFPSFGEDAIVISQYRPQERFSGTNALRRNLLIAALSDAEVVVAASAHPGGGRKSGSLDAGEQALRLGLPLFVVSPSLLRPEPEGNRTLIEAGGREIAHASDVLERLDLALSPSRWPAAFAHEVETRRAEVARQRQRKGPAPEQMSLF